MSILIGFDHARNTGRATARVGVYAPAMGAGECMRVPLRTPGEETLVECDIFSIADLHSGAPPMPATNSSVSPAAALAALMTGLAERYAAEGRPGGDAAATALAHAARQVPASLPLLPHSFDAPLAQAFGDAPDDLGRLAAAAAPVIRWRPADLGEDRIGKPLADAMPMCELVGPDGMFLDAHIRVGLWVQTPGLTYGPRRHAAEETFLILAGQALWQAEGRADALQSTGAIIHHPSNILHTSITTDRPLLAAWRWSGEVGFEHYALTG